MFSERSKNTRPDLLKMWQGPIDLAYFDIKLMGLGDERKIGLHSTEADIIRYNSGIFGIRGLWDMSIRSETPEEAMRAAARRYGGLIYDKSQNEWIFYSTQIKPGFLIIRSPEDIGQVVQLITLRYSLTPDATEEFQKTLTRLINFSVPDRLSQ